MSRTEDPRLREIMSALVNHLHAFTREVRLTETEWEFAIDYLLRIGQATSEKKNEMVLLSDLLGLSSLVVLLNNEQGKGETDAALLGPFWRAHAPMCAHGESIARDSGGGETLAVAGLVRDLDGKPVAGAIVDVWQASPVGLYENQDEQQPDHNLRGRFETNSDGHFDFLTVRPKGYPVPVDGPCGELLRAQDRHPYRPAHLHFMIAKEGFKTLVTQVFPDDDQAIASDVVFGVTAALSGNFERKPDGTWKLDYEFVMQPGKRRIPKAPIP